MARHTGGPDEDERPAVDEDPVQDERRQAQHVVAVEVGQEDDLDVAGVDTQAVHVREKGRAAVQQHPAVRDDRAVVPVQRERRTATEEREL